MNKKRLMIVIWNMDIGGIQKLLRDMLIHIQRTRPSWEVYLVVKNMDVSIWVKEIQQNTQARVIYHPYQSKTRLIKSFHFIYWLGTQFIRIRPDVCLTFLDQLSIIIAVMRIILLQYKTKLVLGENVLTSNYVKLNKRPPLIWNVSIALCYRLAYRILVPSVACKKDLIKHYHIPKRLLCVVPNWTLIKEVRIQRKRYDLLFAGRFAKEKNLIALLYLVDRLKYVYPSITLCLIGKGKDEQMMRSFIRAHNLEKHVIIHGFHPEIAPYYQQSKIYIMTTVNEGMPVSLIEAGAYYLPSVVTNFPGAPEIIIHGVTGYICNSMVDMEQNILKLLKNRTVRNKLGNNAHAYVTKLFGRSAIERYTTALLV